MKNPYLLILSISLSLLLSSCYSTMTNLQVCNFNADGFSINKNAMTNVGEDINITSNLWGHKGSNTFFIANNTDEDIIIHLDQSFIIINGKAYDLKTSQSGIIPNKSYKQFQIGNNISDLILIDKKQMSVRSGSKTTKYTIDNTPLTYRIKIKYTKESGITNTKEYKLWVSSITHYAQKERIQKVIHIHEPERYFDIEPKPNQIYNYYNYTTKNTAGKNNIPPISVRKERK